MFSSAELMGLYHTLHSQVITGHEIDTLPGSQSLSFNPSTQKQTKLYQVILKRVQNNFHLVLNYSPSGEGFKERLKEHSALMVWCTMIWATEINGPALKELGHIFVLDNITEVNRKEISKNDDILLKASVKMYMDTKEAAISYYTESDHILYFTPSTFLNLFLNYNRLNKQRKRNV